MSKPKQQIKPKTIHDLLWNKLTRGVTDKLEQDGTRVDKWSPNNLRRLIISPEGVVFQPFVTRGTFFNNSLGVVQFPISEETAYELHGKRTILSVLYRDRIFSSIEEIVIIPKSPNVPYNLSENELQRLQTKIKSFKRLSSVILVKDEIPLKDFIQDNKDALQDKFNPLSKAENKGSSLSNSVVMNVVSDWYNHTSLRPQFYSLDEEGKELQKRFQEVKDYYANLNKDSSSSRKSKSSKEKSAKTDETAPNALSKRSKQFLTYRKMLRVLPEEIIRENPRFVLYEKFGDSHNEQTKIKKGFRFKGDEGKRILTLLGLWDEEGSSDNEKLQLILKNQIDSCYKKMLESLSNSYSLLSKHIKRVISDDAKSKVILKYDVTHDFNKITSMDSYEGDIESIRDSMLERLNGITLSKIKEVIAICSFDYGEEELISTLGDNNVELDKNGNYSHLTDISNELNLVILHDLYIHFNKVKHRPYCSLLTTDNKGSRDYVKDQSIYERIEMLGKELKDGKADARDSLLEELDKLLQGVSKDSFNEDINTVKQQANNLKQRIESDTDSTSEEDLSRWAIGVLIDTLNQLSSTKAGKLAVLFNLNKLKLKTKLGCNTEGVDTQSIPSELKVILDGRKNLEDGFEYIKLLRKLTIKEK